MNPRKWTALALAIAMLPGPWAIGCAKRVPAEGGTFEAQQEVVLTFSDDRIISGKMDQNSSVTYRDAEGNRYRARVRSLSEESIVLENLVLVASDHPIQEVTRRMADSRIVLDEPVPEVTLTRSEIQNVERIGFDAGRTFKNISFWAFSGAILALILNERS